MAKNIIILGGGFSGMALANKLVGTDYDVTIVDKNNYVFFPPLLYQVATGFLEVANISYPFRKMYRNKRNISFKMGTIERIVPDRHKIVLDSCELEYDMLVIATGTVTNYFGMENVKAHSIPMKSINDATAMRNYILKQYEQATNCMDDPAKQKKLLDIVVAGGGPTGVEISGMLAEMQTSVFKKDYPELKQRNICGRIYLIEGGPCLLPPLSVKSQRETFAALEKLGVRVMLNAQVVDYKDDQVVLKDGQLITTENLIWAAGVVAQSFEGIPGACYGRGHRLQTDAFNKVEGLEDIYAIGDTCIQQSDTNYSSGHPQVAQVALQQGKNLANNFINKARNKSLTPFKYKDKGSMAIIGRNKAVADIGKMHFSGFIAWFIWIFIHLFSLVQYRNRVTTLYNWIIAYFTKDQALRMIIRPSSQK